MKANELRIGNYIQMYEEDTFIVINLTLTDICNVESDTEHRFQPIKLTENWLRKSKYNETLKEWKGNGQDYQPETSKTKQIRYELTEDIYLIFQYFSYRANKEDKWITDRSIMIEYYGNLIQLTRYYIHTLQNLYFALTNKELKINI